MKTNTPQSGATLIEVLVAVLILSFGMLALGGMLAYAVQMPRLAAYRSTAVSLAAAHIERIRANPTGYTNGDYKETTTYRSVPGTLTPCSWPNCTPTQLAEQDRHDTNTALSRALPEGGMRLICSSNDCTLKEGEMWVMWTEPTTFASISTSTSDECPDPTTAPSFTPFTAPLPRCLHIKFKL